MNCNIKNQKSPPKADPPLAEKIKNMEGVISLAAILILGAVIVEIALIAGVLVYLLNFTNLGIRLSAEAFAAAGGGIEDGLMRIIRMDYPGTPPGNGTAYAIPATGSAGATVTISNLSSGKYEITAVGQALSKKRQLVAVAAVDPVTGLVTVQTVEERPL